VLISIIALITIQAYAASVFDHLHADAVTINGYMGIDVVEPFIISEKYKDKGVFTLCKTSNMSSQVWKRDNYRRSVVHSSVICRILKISNANQGQSCLKWFVVDTDVFIFADFSVLTDCISDVHMGEHHQPPMQ
jgi:hypothetical protein